MWLIFGAGAAAAAEQPTLNGRELSAAAGWHQRAVRRAVETSAPASQSRRAPAGWSAGAVRFGDGRALRDGSRRVKEVQRRLRVLGYHPGPVNGVYGERTRDAVGWFQYKHQLTLDGIVGLVTLRHIRAAQADTLARPDQPAQARPDTRDAAAPVAPRRAADAPASDPAATAASGFAGIAWWLWGLIAAGALALVALVAALLHRRRGRSVTDTDTAPVYELWVQGSSPDPAIGPFRGIVKAVSVPDDPRPAGGVSDSQYLVSRPHQAPPLLGPRPRHRRARSRPPAPRTPVRHQRRHPPSDRRRLPAPAPTTDPTPRRTPPPSRRPATTAADHLNPDLPRPRRGRARPKARPPARARTSSRRGEASCLVVAHLSHVASDIGDRGRTSSDARANTEATVVITDIDLDTATAGGRRTAAALRHHRRPEPGPDPLPYDQSRTPTHH